MLFIKVPLDEGRGRWREGRREGARQRDWFEKVVAECFPKFTNGHISVIQEAVQISTRINTK